MDPIRLGEDCVYLSASGPTDGLFRLAVHGTLNSSLTSWQPSTRLSPIWPVLKCADRQLPPVQAGSTLTGFVLFIGPHRPHETIEEVLFPNVRAAQVKHVSVSLGLYNVIVFLSGAADVDRVCAAVERVGSNWELWKLQRGTIQGVTKSQREASRSWVPPLTALAGLDTWPHPLRGAMEEYLPLMASALARSETALPAFTDHLVQSMRVVSDVLTDSGPDTFQKQSQVTHINAALSRLSSQMFSGVSPILATECHYWVHSLLGTGTANLGLHNLSAFIQAKMGEYKIPDRIAALGDKSIPALPVLSTISPSDPAATKHYLDDVQFDGVGEPLIPLISYFSGRDGFKSNTTIISVPLSTISNANATPWTLQTLTHEVSHIVIEAVLSLVLPDPAMQAQMQRALKLLKEPSAATTWLESLRAHIARGFVSLHASETGTLGKSIDLDTAALQSVYMDEIRNVTEVLVHVFDFMYFYNSEPDTYVNGIWTSWSAIPEIADRIPEYVVRTTCGVASKHLTRPGPERNAIQQVRQILAGMGPHSAYAADAVAYIDRHASQIEQAVLARIPFVQFVRSFLFSPNLAGALQVDALTAGRASRSGGYEIHRGELTAQLISNPLLFVSHFTRDSMPAPSEAVVLWQTLAFGIASDSRGGS